MPIVKPEGALFNISKFKIYRTDNGYAMQLVCPRATAYVLCFSNGAGNIDCEKLGLTEEDLICLHDGGTIQRSGCRLQGVTSRTFHAMPQFRGFVVNPPERIQIWSMVTSYGKVTLYHTDNEISDYIPLCYTVKYGSEEDYVTIEIGIEKREVDNYTDGALMYKIDSKDPVPLPKSWINRPIRLNTDNPAAVKVIIQEEYAEKYKSAD